jgi:hypothetical protein
MKTSYWTFLVIFSLLIVGWGCGSDATPTQEEEASEQIDDPQKAMEQAAKEVEKAMEKLNDGEKVEVVNFRDLKKLLPGEFAGVDQTETGGETTGMMGFSISTANAEYVDGDQRVEVNIVDSGGMGTFIMAQAAWANMTVDRETNDGYERTTKIDGYPGFEKVEDNGARAELNVLVGKRFIVSVQGRNVDMDDLKKSLKKIDLDKLASM